MTGTTLNGPALPGEHEGKVILWTPWRENLVGSCGRPVLRSPCKGCGAENVRWITTGTVNGELRATGHYCPACGELRVYWKVPPPPGKWAGRLDLIEHSTRQERLDAAMERVGARLRQAVQAELRRAARRSAAWPFTPSGNGE